MNYFLEITAAVQAAPTLAVTRDRFFFLQSRAACIGFPAGSQELTLPKCFHREVL